MKKNKKIVVIFMVVFCFVFGTVAVGYAATWPPSDLPSYASLDEYGSYGEVWIPDDLTASGITEFNDSGAEKPMFIGVEISGEIYQNGVYVPYSEDVEAYKNIYAGISEEFTSGEVYWVAGNHWCETNVRTYTCQTFSWN